ncbi:hypothetical protein [Cobetia amphilecti]|uniref:hypothetical protein n=1 Tax=Cobetia amphilecti TaxID=1055104 RepID=UPI0032982E7A
MSKVVTLAQIQLVKTAAKRLKKYFPSLKLQKCQDIAAYQILGVSDFHEAVTLSKVTATSSPLNSENDSQHEKLHEKAYHWRKHRKFNYAEHTGLTPVHSVGSWNYFIESNTLSFDGEYIPYIYSLGSLTTTAKLLDFVLQLQKKRWPRQEAEDNEISPDYQVKEFLDLMNDLSEAYLDMPLQVAFSPRGESKVVDWESSIKKRGSAALYSQIAKKDEFVKRFGL